MANTVKDHLLGIFEIFLFMPRGFENFSADTNTMIKSFIWPLIITPLVLLTIVMLSDGTYPAELLFLLHGSKIIISFIICLALTFIFCKSYDRLDFLYKYITIANWFELAMFALTAPILFCLSFDIATAQDMQTYALFVTLIYYVYAAYILTHTLRIPWEMGGFISISFMFVNETGMDIVNYLKDF